MLLWIVAIVATIALIALAIIVIWSACAVAGRVDQAQEVYWSQHEEGEE